MRTYFTSWKPVLIDTLFEHAKRTATNDEAWLALDAAAAAVHAYLAAPIARPGRPLVTTVDELLDEWKKVLNDIWNGYPCSEDNFTNDLDLRDVIEDVGSLRD